MKQNLLGLFLLLLIVREVPAQKATDYSVTHYNNENGLPQNSIKGIELDKNGFLWLGTESGLLRFDGQQFKLYDRNHYPLITSNRMGIMGLTEDSLIFFFDENRNYFSFNKWQELIRSETYTPAKAIPVKKPDAYDPICKFLLIKGRDEGFIANGDEFYYISGKKKLWTRYLPDAEGTVNSYSSTGHLNEKAYYLNKQFKIKSIDKKGIIRDVLLKGVHPDLKTTGPYNYCFFQQAETLYILIGKGIYKLQESGGEELTADLVLQTDVPGIFSYRNYPSLNLQVVGSLTHGLYLYRKKQFNALRYINGYGNFYPQAVYQDSGVLTSRGLVYSSFSKFNYPFDIGERWRGLLRDSRGHYWVNIEDTRKKTTSFSIAELDEHLKVVKKYKGWTANCFRETPDGNIWLSASGEKRIGKIKKDAIEWLSKIWPERSILTFLPENNEEFWVGGVRTFAKLNVRTGKEQHYKKLEQFTIETLYLDADKVLWIGTTGNGFFALKQNKIYQLPLDVKNNLSNVHAFIEDKSGFMWMSTNNGLFRCRKEELMHFIDHKAATVYYQYFSKESGFNTNEFNGSCTPSAVVLGNGKFSFPSLDGLVQFYPDSIQELLPEAKIFIDKLLVDGKKQDLSSHPALEPSFGRLEIEVASPFFGNPANQQVEYNVKGLDQSWYPVKNDNIVTLNNLPYGDYSLQFRKRAGFGSNNIITTALQFTVLPFYYQTWYFKLTLLVLAVVIIFIGVRLRYAKLMKRNRTLEQEVSQRTLHLQNANRLKEKMLMMVGHDLQSPLHFMSLLSSHVDDALEQQLLDKARTGNKEVRSTALKIHAFVEEFNLWARLQDAKFNLSKRTFSLSEVIIELDSFFTEMFSLHNNRFEFKTDNEVYTLHTNRELLKAILRNLLDNANKHTRNGHIVIQCYKNDSNELAIKVSDTGKGMSAVELNNIQRRIEKQEDAFLVSHTSKLGYQLIIDFVANLDARLSIESEKDKGTAVTISGLPFSMEKKANEHLFSRKTVSRGELE